MSTNSGQKLWNFCYKLRYEGVDYGDYIEQLTYLLFLKMVDERGIELPTMQLETAKDEKQKSIFKTFRCNWPTLIEQSGAFLLDEYTALFRELYRQQGVLGDILAQAVPKLECVLK